MDGDHMHARAAWLSLLFAAALAGCHDVGPATIPTDRAEYSGAISDSWKSQALLNIVKIRYVDPPIFVDVGQIVASRAVQRSVSAFGNTGLVSGGYPSGTAVGNVGVTGQGSYLEQPTVTYVPLTGNKFVKSLMTPLTPEAVFGLVQSGWPADNILLMSAASLNGLKNQQTSLGGTTAPDPEFLRALVLFRKIQLAGGVAFRVQQQDDPKKASTLLSLRRDDIAPETLADSRELRRLLKLSQDATEFTLVRGATSTSDTEVAIQTRSVFQLMQVMAALVEVPPEHLAEHSAAPGWESATGLSRDARMIEIHHAGTRPDHAFVAVPYNGYWFWIDNRDLKSKRVFLFTMMMFTLADTSDGPPPPVLTIPAR